MAGFKARRGDLQKGRTNQYAEKKKGKETRYLASASTAFAFAVLTMARLHHCEII